jgi:molybdate-binding protein
LVDVLRKADGSEVSVAGSTEAMKQLLAGTADIAGVHCGSLEPPADTCLAPLFADPEIRTLPLFRREQGLLLQTGNPDDVRSIEDLAAKGVRFINRQKGSGTRLWFDRLLDQAAVRPDRIAGYDVEEFTHQAVAAVIASGAAQAGLGVRAVADRFGLAFVAIGWETYFLAYACSLKSCALDDIIAAARESAARQPGYACRPLDPT